MKYLNWLPMKHNYVRILTGHTIYVTMILDNPDFLFHLTLDSIDRLIA